MRFNGIDFDEFVVVEYVRRQLLPSRTIKTKDTPFMRKYFSGVEYGATTIEVDVRILQESRTKVLDIYQRMAGILNTDEPKVLELRDEPGRYNMAILSGDTQLNTFLETGFVTLTFECPDPYLYNMDITTMCNINNTPCVNGGNAPSEGLLTFKVVDAGAEIVVSVDGDEREIHIVYDFKQNDILTIDLETETIWINNILAVPTLDSDFFDLPAGFFKVTLTGVAGVLDVSFRERWYSHAYHLV